MGTYAKPCVLNSTYVTSRVPTSFFFYLLFFFLPHEWRFDVMFVEDEVLIMLCPRFWKQMERKPNVCIALQDNRVSMKWQRWRHLFLLKTPAESRGKKYKLVKNYQIPHSHPSLKSRFFENRGLKSCVLVHLYFESLDTLMIAIVTNL